MRKLAAKLGTSRSTVSRAFRDDASVSAGLRERIRAAAAEHGYHPDPMVTELMTSFAQRRPVSYRETLGVLWWPERWEQTGKPDSFAAQLRAGLDAAALKHGCRLTPFVLDGRDAALARTLRTRQIQGLILTPPTTPDADAPRLDWEKFSAMAIGRSLGAPIFNRVHQDHYGALVGVLRRLRERGFSRPVLLVHANVEERMQRAYTAAFLAHAEAPASHVLHLENFDPAALHRKLARLETDVVIADVGAWQEALRARPERARGVGFVCMDVERAGDEMTGIFQNAARMGECAVDLLMQARLRHATGVPAEPMTVLTPGAWNEGRTLVGAEARSG